MKVDVFDTYVAGKSGDTLHFDIFVRSGSSKELALSYGRQFLKQINEDSEGLESERCNFCHSEAANGKIKKEVEANGCFILQMEGCPNPYTR